MNKIAVIDPIGDHIGLSSFHFGYIKEICKLDTKVFYLTNAKTNLPSCQHLYVKKIYGDLWKSSFILRRFFILSKAILKLVHLCIIQRLKACHFHLFEPRIVIFLSVFLCKVFTSSKIVITIHDVHPFRRQKRNNLLFNQICKYADEIIFFNRYSKKIFQRALPDIKKPLHIVPMGNYNDNSKIKKNKPRDDNTLKMLFFGQIKTTKGIDLILQACYKLKQLDFNFEVVIAGKPYNYSSDKLITSIDNLSLWDKIKVELKFISNEKKDILFSQSDLIILPYTEIYNSAVVMEAGGYKKPVLVSDLEPFLEIITNGVEGYIFNTEDVNDLVETIIGIDKTKLRKTGVNLYNKICTNYTWANHASLLNKIYF
jgi:D-inositol-3-phosphate glycosyltransferase